MLMQWPGAAPLLLGVGASFGLQRLHTSSARTEQHLTACTIARAPALCRPRVSVDKHVHCGGFSCVYCLVDLTARDRMHQVGMHHSYSSKLYHHHIIMYQVAMHHAHLSWSTCVHR